MEPLGITAVTLVSAIGRGLSATTTSLQEGKSGLVPCNFDGLALNTYIGMVAGIEDAPVISNLRPYDCRNSRLAQVALRTDGFEASVQEAIKRFGAGRIGTIIGTTSSGIQEAEHAYATRRADSDALPMSFSFEHSQSHYSVTHFVRCYLGLSGPAFTVSTACSSSAKAFVDAQQLIASGICDAVVVGGVDSLCWMSLCGFHSLQLLSSRPCRPNDANRDGLSIGEAAGFALLERIAAGGPRPLVKLLGYGESCDAHHMSAPHPEGLGAALAMSQALSGASIDPSQVDYINLHGTGSPANDRIEDLAIHSIFGPGRLCSSTKGSTGHTLGAAGMTELAIATLALLHQFIPGNLNLETADPELRQEIVRETRPASLRYVLTNSFGFGGSNCSLILGKP